jgi:hypothetical protein
MNTVVFLLVIILAGATLGAQWQRIVDRFTPPNPDPFWLRALPKAGGLTVTLIIAWLLYLYVSGGY